MAREKTFYTTVEAAKLLDVSVRTIQLWVEDGKLEGWKTAGGHRRINAESIEAMLNEQSTAFTHKAIELTPKILVVEDNLTELKFYEAAINSWNFPVEIITAQDGFHGLMEIGRVNPSLIITDIYMPGMDGLQMIRALSKEENIDASQIIVISGLSEQSILERGGIPSGIRFFNKPVDLDKLKQIIISRLNITK